MSLNSLTDAMLASALAAKRLTPSSTGTSSAITQHHPATLGGQAASRQRSPHLLPTLRNDHGPHGSDENNAERRRKKHTLTKIGAKGKHRHHEGSRKRWREEVTERERKRYEALWASNRGAYLVDSVYPVLEPAAIAASIAGSMLPKPPAGMKATAPPRAKGAVDESTPTDSTTEIASDDERDLVANVVVRELWRRSRLPYDELAEVWDLVDRQMRGALNKQEFVVGMWLIDQRLRGRKIPHRVQKSEAKGLEERRGETGESNENKADAFSDIYAHAMETKIKTNTNN
ncbi:Increased rDNA silencing protein 4 [Ceratocystis platani]|uniref:Increased rDNA silencing protein 4 n=1 Tax=Ceratocystis fimbriata f. sp. platani TaxID=88771 RepID=A0A0F8DL13_CERFI|nr:Increased rDNA silencing protein 4 [Ceratocystis platani]